MLWVRVHFGDLSSWSSFGFPRKAMKIAIIIKLSEWMELSLFFFCIICSWEMSAERAHSMLNVDLLTGYASNHRAYLNKVPFTYRDESIAREWIRCANIICIFARPIHRKMYILIIHHFVSMISIILLK